MIRRTDIFNVSVLCVIMLVVGKIQSQASKWMAMEEEFSKQYLKVQ